MDLFVLDYRLRRSRLFDRYESLIWTDRYADEGDFEFHIQATDDTRKTFVEGTLLAVNESKHIMMAETFEEKNDSEGRAMLKITGRSLEGILRERIARHTLADLTAVPLWRISGTPGDIARQLFKTICMDGVLDFRDIIPFIQAGSISPPSTISEPNEIITMEFEPDSLFAIIKNVCDSYGLGFRLVRNGDASELYFEIYTGSDRTTAQKLVPATVFSPEQGTLTNTSELVSIEKMKNVAHVISKEGTAIVYADAAASGKRGFSRRVLYVKIDSIQRDDSELSLTTQQILEKRGRDALAQNRRIAAFDGEIPQFGYRYGIDYSLGDIVEMRKRGGVINYMRVTEQIFIADSEGDRSYPTLSIEEFITPGSWYSWDALQTWDEATGTWSEAPVWEVDRTEVPDSWYSYKDANQSWANATGTWSDP